MKLKDSLKIFKKKWYVLVPIEIIFWILILLALFVSAGRINMAMSQMDALAPELNHLQNTLTQDSDLSILDPLLNQLNNILNQVYLTLIITILFIFLLFVIMQSFQFNYSYKAKSYFNYLKKFLIIALMLFLLFIPILYYLYKNLLTLLLTDSGSYLLFFSAVFLYLILYLANLLFILSLKYNFRNSFSQLRERIFNWKYFVGYVIFTIAIILIFVLDKLITYTYPIKYLVIFDFLILMAVIVIFRIVFIKLIISE